MSRVDEARRRAAGRDGAQRAESAGAVDFPGEDYVLEHYPRERRGVPDCPPVGPAARPGPAAARAIAAPRSTATRQLGWMDPALAGKLVGSPDTPPFVVEQYRRLGAALHELHVDTGLKTLMVTSALPREGKTLTVTNLALTLTESYRKRVLLIDADLRRPSLHEVFRLPRTAGLSEALKSGSRPHLLEVSPLLSILPAGEAETDPLSALTSDRFATLLQDCAAAFDWVLLDAPPVGLMPDGSVLARLTKAVVFIIAAGMTPHKVIESAIAELGRDCIVGIVLNRIDEQELPSAHHYSEYYPSAGSLRTGDFGS
jgi:capsular exopolysaccharide synthesis family protein